MSNEENLIKSDGETVADGNDRPVSDAETSGEAVLDQTAADNAVAEDSAADGETEAGEESESADPADASVSDDEEEKAEKDDKPVKADKPKKAKAATAGAPKGMSKLFKLIYYPVLAVIALVMLIFSVIDGVYGYKPQAYDDAYYTAVNGHISALSGDTRSAMSYGGITSARDYIVKTLTDGGFAAAEEVKSGEDEDSDAPVTTVTDFAKDASKTSLPTVTVMTSVPSIETQNRINSSEYVIGYSVTNIVAAIPGTVTRSNDKALDADKADAAVVILTVRYDTRPDTDGAASNAAFVATAMQTLIEYAKAGTDFKNDIVVVFTEELDNSLGSYSFFESFKGLNDAVARARYGRNLDAYGNGGTLALTDMSGAGYDYLSAYTGISGSVFNSSLVPDSIPENYRMSNAVAAFGDIPSLQVAVLGGLDAAGSLKDNAESISQSIVYQEADLIKSYIDEFAASSESVSAENGKAIAAFSYFDAGTVAYNEVASYVIGVLILLLIAGAITLTVVKKTFSLKNMIIALGVEALVVASALVAMFAAYFLITLMLTGFGVLPIHAITQLRYFNAGIFIAAMFIALASAFGFTTLYKKLFKVTSSDTVRGTALLFGLVGAIISFAAPAYSYMASLLGLLLNAVLLVTVCLNNKLKERFGVGFDRLFVFTVPVILCLPFTVSGLSMMTELLPLYMLPVTMMLFTGMLGVIVPYLDRTRVVFDRIAKKLPKRTQRVEHVVTERVEDRAKKGKFTEREVKRVDKEKVAVNYKNYFGVSVIAVIGVITALFSGGFGASFGQTITPLQAYDRAIYNDSLVYEVELGTNNATSEKIIIDDLMAYKYMRYAVDGLEWDAANNYYYKTVSGAYKSVIGSNFSGEQKASVIKSDSVYTVNAFDGANSYVTLTFPSTRSVTKITVKPSIGTDEFVYEFSNQDSITLRMPYGFGGGSFTVEFEGADPSSVDYREYREVLPIDGDTALDNLDDWNAVINHYRDQDIVDNLRGGIVIKRSFKF